MARDGGDRASRQGGGWVGFLNRRVFDVDRDRGTRAESGRRDLQPAFRCAAKFALCAALAACSFRFAAN